MQTQTRSEKMMKNVSMGILSKLVVLIIGFIDRKFFISILGEELLGVNGLFSNILLVLSLAEMGLTNVMVFSYYEPLAKDDHDKLNSLTAFYKRIYNTIAIIVALIGLAIIPVLKYIVKVEEPIENMVWIYLVFLANTVMSYLFVYKSTILTADQNGYVVTQTQIKFDVIRQILQVIILILTKSIIVYLLVKVIVLLLNNLYLMRCVDKKYTFLDLKHATPLSKEEKNKILSTIKSGLIYKISSVLLNGTDNILISMLVGTVWVGLVANYDTVITSITGFVVIIFTSLTASVGNLHITAEPKKKLEIFNVVLFVGFWLALIVIPCCYNLMGDLVSVWLGERFVLEKDVLATKLGMMYLSCTLNPIFSFREATGLFRKSKYMIFAGSLVNIALSIILGMQYGVFGILLASIIAMITTYVWYEPVILYREFFETSPMEYFVKHIVNIVKLFIIIFVSSVVMNQIVVDNWGMLFLKGALCFTLVFTMSFLLMFRKAEFRYVCQTVSKLFGKFKLKG